MKVREAFDRLLEAKPGIEVTNYDAQLGRKMMATDVVTGVQEELTRLPPGPWVCVDFEDGEQFAIWKTTGVAYRLDASGAVEDDPVNT